MSATTRLDIRQGAGYVAAAVLLGLAAGAVEFCLGILVPPGGALSWSYFLGPAPLIYGIQGPWQLLAHKAFAYGWLVPCAAALIAAACWPLWRAFRRGSWAPQWGLSVAAGLYVTAQVAIPINYLFKSPRAMVGSVVGTQSSLVVAIGAATFLAATAASWGFFSTPLFKRLRRARPTPAVAAVLLAAATMASFWPRWESRPPVFGPDVLVITIDALRADKVGPGPNGTTLTPHIDDFARGARTYAACYASAPWTLPSLSTLLTGLEPPAHGADWSAPLAPGYYTLAEAFYDAGYDTAAIGSNSMCEPRFGLGQGFDYYRTIEMWPGSLATRFYYTLPSVLFRTHGRAFKGTTPKAERLAVNYLKRKARAGRGRRPFFMWVHFLDPHDPYAPPPAWVDPKWAAYPLKDNLHHATSDERVAAEANYDGEVRYVDDAVGRVLAAFYRATDPNTAVVVISSDHGEEFWEHGGWNHGHTLYNELLRVPLIVRAPTALPAGREDRPVATVDVGATVADICGITTFNSPQGLSFAREPQRRFFFGTGIPNPAAAAVTDGRYKVVPAGGTEGYQLFDLTVDPGETTPLADEWRRARYLDLIVNWRKENAEVREALAVTPVGSSSITQDLRALGYIK